MKGNEKSRPGVAAPKRERVSEESVFSYTSEANFSTQKREGQLFIADFLHRGEANATTKRELRNIIHLPERTIRLMVQDERRRGIPILSGQRGYWLAESADEIRQFYRNMTARADEIRRSAACVLMALPDFEGRAVARHE